MENLQVLLSALAQNFALVESEIRDEVRNECQIQSLKAIEMY